MKENLYIKTLETAAQFSKPAIIKAMESLDVPNDAEILDAPCGTGNHMKWFLDQYPGVRLTGIDIDPEHVATAINKLASDDKIKSCKLKTGDLNKLEFANNSFDIVWCCDGLWPGPKKSGCAAEKPYGILDEMIRTTKNKGTIAILFWSSQKLLPGHPYIEAELAATLTANRPLTPQSNPELHFMNTSAWLRKAGLKNIRSRTFTADIKVSPDQYSKVNMKTLFDMFWGSAEKEVNKEVWSVYKRITNARSSESVLNSDYTGFLTYTIFTGTVDK